MYVLYLIVRITGKIPLIILGGGGHFSHVFFALSIVQKYDRVKTV